MTDTSDYLKPTGKQGAMAQVLHENPDLWRVPWRKYCITKLAQAARDAITSFHPLRVDDAFAHIADPNYQLPIINGSEVAGAVAIVLAGCTETGGLRSRVDAFFVATV